MREGRKRRRKRKRLSKLVDERKQRLRKLVDERRKRIIVIKRLEKLLSTVVQGKRCSGRS